MLKWKTLGTILFSFLFVVFCSLPGKPVIAVEKMDPTKLALKGRELTNKEALKLEEKLRKNPDDLSIRTMLLGYYDLKAFKLKDARKARQRHVVWIIQNYPESKIAGLPYTNLDPLLDGEKYYEAKKLWLKQVETHKENTAIIGNAANFLLLNDMDTAETLLKKAKALEPRNPKWSERLGHFYSLGMREKSDKSRKEAASKSLEQMEEALNLTTEDNQRFYMLGDLAMIAFEAGEVDKASKYASELLQKAPQYKNNWNYGNGVHKGNLILGRIALASGRLDEAKDYLLKAGKTSGSPQLNSFGPNMTLAKELLEKGEREVVVKYFEECGKFWEMGEDRLKDWMAIVNKGGMPDFGANLDY
jgi:tetratricopeptide (TPR) repeat protein